MIISELSPSALASQLRDPGIDIRTGPFVVRLQSGLPGVTEGIRILYADFPLVEDVGFADFHIRLRRSCTLRRWIYPQIVISSADERPFSPLPLRHAFAAFETFLNWCISSEAYQYLLIHAASVERNGRAAILAAPPGSGKSTLCAALVSRGWRLMTDELTLICPKTETILPLSRPISLKNDSISIISQFARQAIFGPETRDTIKGTIAHMRPPKESVSRMHEPAAPGYMIFPKYEAGSATTSRLLDKAETFMRIPAGLVNYPVLGESGFNLLTRLIDQTDCYEFAYSNLEEATAWFEQLNLSRRFEGSSHTLLSASSAPRR